MKHLLPSGASPMRSVLLILFALCSASFVRGETPEEARAKLTAERWMSLCRAVTDGSGAANGDVLVDNDFVTGECFGAFKTLIEVARIVDDHGNPVLGVCVPRVSTYTQWIAIFVDSVKRHPKRYNDPFILVAIASAKEAFPCRSK